MVISRFHFMKWTDSCWHKPHFMNSTTLESWQWIQPQSVIFGGVTEIPSNPISPEKPISVSQTSFLTVSNPLYFDKRFDWINQLTNACQEQNFIKGNTSENYKLSAYDNFFGYKYQQRKCLVLSRNPLCWVSGI